MKNIKNKKIILLIIAFLFLVLLVFFYKSKIIEKFLCIKGKPCYLCKDNYQYYRGYNYNSSVGAGGAFACQPVNYTNNWKMPMYSDSNCKKLCTGKLCGIKCNGTANPNCGTTNPDGQTGC